MFFFSRISTTTNFSRCLDEWTLMLDEKSKIYIMCTDLEEAFHSLTNQELWFILSKIGFGENLLTRFSNSLTGRFYNVKVSNVRSEYITVNSGVPRGTILRPLLFVLFINNVSAGLRNSEIQLFTYNAKLMRATYPRFAAGSSLAN